MNNEKSVKNSISEDIFPVDENDDDVMVTLDLDDGTEMDCEILTIFTVAEQDYIALLPVDEDGIPYDYENALLYRYSEGKDGAPSIDNIISDEEYSAVEKQFALLQSGNQQ